MSWEELLIRWTARLAVGCYLARIAVDAAWPLSARRLVLGRWVWTVGCVIFLAHVYSVFQFLHGWSHAAAWEHTRAVTFATTGWNSGSGLYLNYLLTLWWVGDVAAWWYRRDWPLARWPFWSLHGFFAFMMFHSTVTFGPGGWKYVAAAALPGLGTLWLRRRWQQAHATTTDQDVNPRV